MAIQQCRKLGGSQWMQVAHMSKKDEWPLLFLLSIERIDKEELLNESMDKSASYKFNPKKKCKELCIYCLKSSMSGEILTCLIFTQRLQQNSPVKSG